MIAAAVAFAAGVSLLAGASAVHGASVPQAAAREALVAQRDGRIEELRAQLRLPGPEARVQREAAVAQLLAMAEEAAHVALRELLVETVDQNGLVPHLLDQLRMRLRNPHDAVLGLQVDGAAPRRAAYLAVLMRRLGRDAPLDVRLRETVFAFASWERVVAVRGLLADDQAGVRAAGARAAGWCRDLSVAVELAGHLDGAGDALAPLLRAALERLTFVQGGFASEAEFGAWFERVGAAEKTFVHLAEEAAERVRADARADREALITALESAVVALVDSYVDRPEVDWVGLGERLLGDGPERAVRAGLRRLRARLSERVTLTGVASDRLLLLDSLGERLERASDPEQEAVLLELCAYLVAPEELDRRNLTLARLTAELHPGQQPVVRRAALAGLARFPSTGSLESVLQVLREALDRSDQPLLARAMATIAAWPAPERKERGEWLRLIEACVLDARLSVEVRRQALAVLAGTDAEGRRVPEAQDVLARLVVAPDQDVSLREIGLLRLADAADTQNLDGYLQALIACLSDPSERVRKRAAGLLPRLPPAESREQHRGWLRQVLDAARPRLLIETDAGVHQQLAQSMRQLGEQGGEPQMVIAVLAEVGTGLAGTESGADGGFRRAHVIEALRILASAQDREPELWIRAGEAIAALRDRAALRFVLMRPLANQAGAAAALPAPLAARVRTLRLAAARLAPPDLDWSATEQAAERDAVLAAVEAQTAAGTPPNDPLMTALRMRLHAARGEHEAVVDLAAALAASGADTLPDAHRRATALCAARSHRSQRQLVAARDWLLPLVSASAPDAPAIRLLQDLAKDLVKDGNPTSAVPALRAILDATPADSIELPARVLTLAETMLRADPQAAGAVKSVLDEQRGLFTGEGVNRAHARRYDALLRQLEGAAGG